MNKELSTPVIIAIIVVVVILIGLIGWRAVGTRRGPNGEDLSQPAKLPANLRHPAPPAPGGH